MKGTGGIFTVVVDGVKVWDKKDTRRFPKDGEVVDAIVKAFPNA